MLTAFGTFWAGEGVGVDWPGGDLALPAIAVLVLAWSLLYVQVLRRTSAVATV